MLNGRTQEVTLSFFISSGAGVADLEGLCDLFVLEQFKNSKAMDLSGRSLIVSEPSSSPSPICPINADQLQCSG